MSFVNKLVKDIRKEYQPKQENRTSIEFMYITRAIRKGSVNNGTNWK